MTRACPVERPSRSPSPAGPAAPHPPNSATPPNILPPEPHTRPPGTSPAPAWPPRPFRAQNLAGYRWLRGRRRLAVPSDRPDQPVEEGLRMTEHPGVVFRDGPTGLRVGLVDGPDVWEVARALQSARAAEPELTEE